MSDKMTLNLGIGGLEDFLSDIEKAERTTKDFSKVVDKINNKKIKLSAEITAGKSEKEIEKLNKAIEQYNKLIDNNGKKREFTSSKAKLFTTEENAINSLKRAWNTYVSDVKNNKVNKDDILSVSSSDSAKEVLKYFNVLEALTGDKDKVRTLNKEVTSLVDTLRSPSSNVKNYNYDAEQLKPVFNILKDIKSIAGEDLLSNVTKGFKETVPEINNFISLLEVLQEQTNKNTSSNSSSATSAMVDSYNEEAKAAEKATEQIKALTQAEMERKLKSEHQKGEVNEWLYDYSDEENKLEKYNQKFLSGTTTLDNIQDELVETRKEAEKTAEALVEVYRGVQVKGTNGITNRERSDSMWSDAAVTFASSSPDVAALYQVVRDQFSEQPIKLGDGEILKEIISLQNALSLDNGGKSFEEITYWGEATDEAGKKAKSTYESLLQILKELQDVYGVLITENAQLYEDNWGNSKYSFSQNGEGFGFSNAKELAEGLSEEKALMPEFVELIQRYMDAKTSLDSQLEANPMFGKHHIEEFAKMAEQAGYSVVEIKNVIDTYDQLPQDIATDYIIIDQSAIKSVEQYTGALSELTQARLKLAEQGKETNIAEVNKTPLSSEQSSTATVSELDKVEDKLEAVEQQAKETTNAVEQVGKTTPTTAPIKDTFDNKSSNEIIEENNRVIASNEEVIRSEEKVKKYRAANRTNIPNSVKVQSKSSANTVDTTAESQEMNKVADATNKAVQEKKNFATANEGVQNSVDGSKSKLELEAELMERVAKSAREAADAKKEFVEANKEVKAITDATSSSISKENDELKNTVASINKTTEQSFDIPVESFKDIIDKFSIIEEKARNIVKITKQMRRDKTGNPLESYRVSYSDGSTETYGENSKPQLIGSNNVVYNAKEFNKIYEEAIKINNALNETKNIVNSLSKHPELVAQFDNVQTIISSLNKELTQGEISVSQYNEAVKKTVSNYSELIKIQQKRDAETYNAKAKEAEQQLRSQLQLAQQIAKEEEKQAKANAKKWESFQKEQQNYLTNQYETDAIERNKVIYQELLNTIKKYAEVSKRIAKNKTLDGDLELAQKLENKISELQKHPILSSSQIAKSERELESLFDTLVTIEKQVSKKRSDQETRSLTQKAKASYDKELKLEQEINKLKIKNISATESEIAANNALIERKQKLIQNERIYREANNLVNSDKEAELINRKNTLTQELATAQEIYNNKLAESTKYAGDIADYMRLLKEETLKANLGLGDKIEFSNGKADGSATITFIKDLGNESEITKIKVDDMLDVIEQLQSGHFDISKYNPDVSIKGKSDNARQKDVDKALKDQLTAWKGIQSIREQIAKTDPNDTDRINTLNVIKKEYQQQYVEAGKILKANEDLYDKEVQLAKLEVERANTTQKIAKATSTISVQDQIDGITSARGKIGQFLNYLKDDKVDTAQYEKLSKEFENIIKKQGEYKEITGASTEETQKLAEATSKFITELKNAADKKQENIAELFNNKLTRITSGKVFDKEYSAIISKIQKKIEKLSETKIVNENDIVNAKEVASLFVSISKDINKVKNVSNDPMHLLPQPEEINKGIGQINKILYGGFKLPSQLKNDLKELKVLYNNALDGDGNVKVTNAQFQELKNTLSKLNAEFEETGKHKSLFGSLTSRITDMNAKFLATYFSWQDWIRYAQQGFEIIKEYDKALTEMTKVSNESIQTLKEFQKESFGLADSIGATASAVQNSTADFMKLGYSLKESAELAKSANIYANVGDMEIDEATEHMVSSVKAWSSEFANDIEASESIVDRYNEIGNNYAITSADIGAAMETSAAALKAGGNTLDESLGLIVSGNLIQQDASTTASALKILSLRIRGAKADLEEMGEETDGLADSSSKMREEIQALTGVDIMLDEDTFKSTAQIIQEVGEAWSDMTDVSQAATLELMAGKNRASTVAGLIENYELIEDVMKTAEESQGSAQRENQRYIESIEGKKLPCYIEIYN